MGTILTIDGLPVLGEYARATPATLDRSSQFNTYFGQNMVGAQDGGGRGNRWVILGTLVGQGADGLALAANAVRSLMDGRAHTFGDGLSPAEWPNCKIGPYNPRGRTSQDAQGRWYQDFSLEIVSLAP